MASGHGPAVDEDELKGDGKKRKFKPLEAVRKFFGKGKRKAKDEQVSVVAVKAKSTTALHHGEDDDDDDGGFKNRQPRPLGGNRSISEDSIFSPDQREPNLQALKKAAVSEESLPKSAFQAELFSKLSKRRSQYSDEDDGLPHSPTPPVTTADIIMGGPLKPLPAGGKSTSRESDNSLISNDASDEEDDPFKSQWKSSVPSKVSKKPDQAGGGAEAPIDFEKVGQTELLTSKIAKDKISIKPRSRKSNRQSRIKRENLSPHSLPSLNEEAPPKSRGDTPSTGSASGDQEEGAAKQESGSSASQPQGSPVEKSGRFTSLPQSAKPSASSPTSRRPVSSSVSTSGPLTSTGAAQQERKETVGDEKGGGRKSGVGPPAVKESRPSVLKEGEKPASSRAEVKSPTVKDFGVAKMSVDMARSETERESRPKPLSASRTMESLKRDSDSESLASAGREQSGSVMSRSMIVTSSSKSGVPSEPSSLGARPKVEFLSSSLKSLDGPVHQPDPRPLQTSSSAAKTSTTAERTSSPVTPKTPPPPSSPLSSAAAVAASPGESRKEGLRQTDSQSSAAFSPKEDYKLRRQTRSKTLPEQPLGKDEPFATRVQRTASHRAEPTSSQNASPELSPRHREKVAEPSKSKEPEWFALARKKTGRQESEEKRDSPSPVREAAPAKEVASASQASVGSTPGPKEESGSSSAEAPSSVSVSSVSSKFNRFGESKPSEVSHIRGGSVKTSPTKTHVFANRGSSVKAQSVKTEVGSAASSSASAPSSQKTGTVSSAAASGAKQDEVKEELKSSEASPFKEAPKWKTQSLKTPSAFSCSSSPSVASSSSKFPSAKTSSQSTPAPLTLSGAKTDSKPLPSPVKTAPLNKTLSEEKEKASVPAWRANLGQKKPPASDIKIELIESTSTRASATSAAAASKKEDAATKEDSAKKEEPAAKAAGASKDVQSDQCRSSAAPGRNSKVMNLLKNFENAQGVS